MFFVLRWTIERCHIDGFGGTSHQWSGGTFLANHSFFKSIREFLLLSVSVPARLFNCHFTDMLTSIFVSGMQMEIRSSLFDNNQALTSNNGGAFQCIGSVLTFLDCLFRNNSATRGGVVFGSGRLTFVNCTLDGNHAEQGAAIYATLSTLTLENSTVQNHVSTSSTMMISDSKMFIRFTNFTNNTGNDGGGVRIV